MSRRGLAAASFATAAGAWAGALGLASGVLDIGSDLDQRLPFRSPVVGAAALTAVVAVPFTVLGALAWRADRRSGPVAMAAGVLLMGWILVEFAFIRSFSFFHPIYFGIGLCFALAGRHDYAGRSRRIHPS